MAMKSCYILQSCQVNTGNNFVDVVKDTVVDLDFKDANSFIGLFNVGVLRNASEEEVSRLSDKELVKARENTVKRLSEIAKRDQTKTPSNPDFNLEKEKDSAMVKEPMVKDTQEKSVVRKPFSKKIKESDSVTIPVGTV